MGFESLIAVLAVVTLLAGVGIAMGSKKRTEKMMGSDKPREPSPLARETADPNFKPDKKVTDPQDVT